MGLVLSRFGAEFVRDQFEIADGLFRGRVSCLFSGAESRLRALGADLTEFCECSIDAVELVGGDCRSGCGCGEEGLSPHGVDIALAAVVVVGNVDKGLEGGGPRVKVGQREAFAVVDAVSAVNVERAQFPRRRDEGERDRDRVPDGRIRIERVRERACACLWSAVVIQPGGGEREEGPDSERRK